LIDTVKALHKEGMTVIMVTQYMEETTGCDRIVVMNRGKVVCDDMPEVVFSKIELLRESNLVPPETVRVRNALRELGYAVSDSVLNAEQLAEAICPLLSTI
jgi:energy-coupling factor transport system ATP-binding protein